MGRPDGVFYLDFGVGHLELDIFGVERDLAGEICAGGDFIRRRLPPGGGEYIQVPCVVDPGRAEFLSV